MREKILNPNKVPSMTKARQEEQVVVKWENNKRGRG